MAAVLERPLKLYDMLLIFLIHCPQLLQNLRFFKTGLIPIRERIGQSQDSLTSPWRRRVG
jgi:hypothetical protein